MIPKAVWVRTSSAIASMSCIVCLCMDGSVREWTHAVWPLQVLNGGALSQELGVTQDLEVHIGVRAVPPEHLCSTLHA